MHVPAVTVVRQERRAQAKPRSGGTGGRNAERRARGSMPHSAMLHSQGAIPSAMLRSAIRVHALPLNTL